jgi:hypothetical protein
MPPRCKDPKPVKTNAAMAKIMMAPSIKERKLTD